MPSIAIFNYSDAGYCLIELIEGELVTVRTEAGDQYTLNAVEQKGKLIVEK